MTGTATKKALIAVGVLVVAYIAYPYFTLYRLGDAIRRGDAAPLESLVDWDRVREGIKEDVCDSVVSPPAAETAQNDKADSALPPFGESFVRGIASNVIDKNVTPSGLVSAAQQSQMSDSDDRSPPDAREPRANPRITWAFFDGPASFSVELLPPGDATAQEPIRIQMELRHGTWKVTRAWLPSSMLVQANSRT
jgi:Protein of unknown function (DUF2939)